MALNLYIDKELVKDKSSIIKYNDAQFELDKGTFKIDDIVKQLIFRIDKSIYIEGTTIKTRYGEYLDMEYLSTGCKTAINVYNHPEKVVYCIECGSNAILEILKLIRNGNIIGPIVPENMGVFDVNINLITYKGILKYTKSDKLINAWYENLYEG